MNIRVRRYRESDLAEVAELFYETVHSVNAADYTEEQLSAWTGERGVFAGRGADLLRGKTFVAECCGKTAGFVSMREDGLLDLLFVHKDLQRRGIASALCDEAERGYAEVRTYASVTARPFFESRGYSVVRKNEVIRRGVALENYLMIRSLR